MQRLTTVVSVGCVLLLGLPLAAQPTDKDPGAMLAVVREASAERVLEARVLYGSAAKEVAQYEANLRDGKYKAGEARVMATIGNTSLAIARLERLGRQLQSMGEPAGVDISLRAADLRFRLDEVKRVYHTLPNTPQLYTAMAAPLPRLSAAKAKSLGAIGTLFKQGKVETAEKRLFETVYDEFEPILTWQTTRTAQDTLAPFQAARIAIEAKAGELRRAEAVEALDQLRADNDPQLGDLIARTKTATDAIAASGEAEWDGAKLGGPALLAAWGQAWRAAHAQALRCRAIDLARGIKAGTRPPSELDQLEAAYSQFDEQMVAAIGKLIAADAARAIPDAIPVLYIQYLDALASLGPQVASPNWLATAEAALAGLRDKSPSLAKEVESYAQATDEILRWRKRASQTAAKARAKEYPSLEEVWQKVGEQSAMVDRKTPGALAIPTHLTTGVPALVVDAARVSLKQQATATDLAPATDGAVVSRYRNRLSARLPLAKLPEQELVDLRKDLLVGPDNPPLTLAAALAIKSAEQGYLQSAGGEIKGLHLESLLGHFITLADKAPHVALGPFLADTPMQGSSTPIEQINCWYELQPQWLQHQYIFVELP